ncbi:hypothetical protein VM98_38385, partial [Streptomyces rubellomurinus subsp. indigoferus]
GVGLRNRLTGATRLRLRSTLVFDHPTPLRLADFLAAAVQGVAASAAVSPATRTDEPVAVVAIGCPFPVGVPSPEDLWELVAGGTDAIGDFPTDRGWDVDALYD